jgi:hypothetical protein
MTEAIKSVIWRKEDITINGKKVYKYLIGTILVTDQKIEGLVSESHDNVAMAQIPTDLNMFTNAYSSIPKYKPPHKLGDLSNAILDIADMTPEDLKNATNEELEDA